MKKKLTIILIFIHFCVFSTSAWAAYDGSVVAPSGQTIYYNFNNTTSTITITVPGYTHYWDPYPQPTGSLVIPDSITHNGINYPVTSIGYAAFRECIGLTSVSLPSTITFIGADAFSNCTALTTINIPDSVTSIGNDAFEYCSNLESIVIPDAVTYIGVEAFQSCTSMTSAIIGNGVTSFGDYAFYGCTSLTNLSLGNSIITIGFNVFKNCSSLTSVIIPDNVDTLGHGAFSRCTALTTVILGNGIHYIGDFSFNRTGLTSVMIPNNVTYIGQQAFYNCTNLTSVIIGDGVDTIEAFTFSNCTNLTSVTMGSGVNYIGNYAFQYCSNISDIYMRGSIPPTLCNTVSWANPFVEVPSTANLHVPCGFSATYQNATVWNQFNIVEALPYILGAISVDTLFGIVEVTQAPTCSNPQAVLLSTANEGYHFSHWNNGITNNPLTITLNSDTAFIAYFAIDSFTVSASSNDEAMGSVTGGGIYAYGDTAMLFATANEGYHFSHWNNGITNNPLTITLNSDTAFIAYFAIDSFTVSASSNDEAMGSVTGGGIYAYGDTAMLFATANGGFHFEGWSITPGYQNISTENPLTIVVIEDLSIIAYFADDSTDGIDDGTQAPTLAVYAHDGNIIVKGADGETVHIFDMMGRQIHCINVGMRDCGSNSTNTFSLPTGIYIVKVGDRPAHKVVVL